jgi:hypothetical protein
MWIAFALSYCAMTALALSLGRHQRQFFAQPLSAFSSTALRVSGFVLLAAVLALCWVLLGAAVGLVMWLALLTAGALVQVTVLACAPRATVPLAAAGLLAAAAGTALGAAGGF